MEAPDQTKDEAESALPPIRALNKEWLETALLFLAFFVVEGYGYAKGLGLIPDLLADLDLNAYIIFGFSHLANIFPLPHSHLAPPIVPLQCLVLLIIAPQLPVFLGDKRFDGITIGYLATVVFVLATFLWIWTPFKVLGFFLTLVGLPIAGGYIATKYSWANLPPWMRAQLVRDIVAWMVIGILFIVAFTSSYLDGVCDRSKLLPSV